MELTQTHTDKCPGTQRHLSGQVHLPGDNGDLPQHKGYVLWSHGVPVSQLGHLHQGRGLAQLK